MLEHGKYTFVMMLLRMGLLKCGCITYNYSGGSYYFVNYMGNKLWLLNIFFNTFLLLNTS